MKEDHAEFCCKLATVCGEGEIEVLLADVMEGGGEIKRISDPGTWRLGRWAAGARPPSLFTYLLYFTFFVSLFSLFSFFLPPFPPF
jgi:hypothetical protein